MGIGELAARTDVPVANIRYYESIGILPKAPRRNGRNRVYGESDVKRLNFVRSNRELGFSLEQVRALIHLSEPRNLNCAEARDLSRIQLKAIRQRIKDLRMIEVELAKHLAVCEDACACGPVAECPILDVAEQAAVPPRQKSRVGA